MPSPAIQTLSPLPHTIQLSKKRIASHKFKLLASNFEVNNFSNFTAYYVGHHVVLLATVLQNI